MEQQQNPPQENSQNQPVQVVSKRNRKIGLFWLIGPFVGLIVILPIYAIVGFVGTVLISEGGSSIGLFRFINRILGLFAAACVFGIIVGIPLGIIYLSKKDVAKEVEPSEKIDK